MYESENLSISTEMLFNERKDFIIIDLTGRTGSGCSYVAESLHHKSVCKACSFKAFIGFPTRKNRRISVLPTTLKNYSKALFQCPQFSWVAFLRLSVTILHQPFESSIYCMIIHLKVIMQFP